MSETQHSLHPISEIRLAKSPERRITAMISVKQEINESIASDSEIYTKRSPFDADVHVPVVVRPKEEESEICVTETISNLPSCSDSYSLSHILDIKTEDVSFQQVDAIPEEELCWKNDSSDESNDDVQYRTPNEQISHCQWVESITFQENNELDLEHVENEPLDEQIKLEDCDGSTIIDRIGKPREEVLKISDVYSADIRERSNQECKNKEAISVDCDGESDSSTQSYDSEDDEEDDEEYDEEDMAYKPYMKIQKKKSSKVRTKVKQNTVIGQKKITKVKQNTVIGQKKTVKASHAYITMNGQFLTFQKPPEDVSNEHDKGCAELSTKNAAGTRRRGRRKNVCEICGRQFSRTYNLEVHRRVHTKERLFHCVLCEKSFKHAHRLRSHMKKHESNEHFANQPEHKRQEKYMCSVCGIYLQTSLLLKQHEQKHKNEAFQCSTCGRCYKHLTSLKLHKKNTHAKTMKTDVSQCRFCEQVFTHGEAFKLHLKIHAGEAEPYKCSMCNERLTSYTNLKRHKLRHKDWRPYKCTVCCKTFRRNDHLKLHMNTHTGKNLFLCSSCGKTLVSKSKLERHQQIHKVPGHQRNCSSSNCSSSNCSSSTICDVCGKSFSSNETLKVHMRIHTNESPYKCSTCGKTFRRSDALSLHNRKHTGEKSDPCAVCGKRFSRRAHLRRHLKTHGKNVM